MCGLQLRPFSSEAYYCTLNTADAIHKFMRAQNPFQVNSGQLRMLAYQKQQQKRLLQNETIWVSQKLLIQLRKNFQHLVLVAVLCFLQEFAVWSVWSDILFCTFQESLIIRNFSYFKETQQR